ncbi:hypothetical protein PUN28_010644 [Cardiocondyla obscurior]|uniref:Uncharacterized protein n=1 Tax=Cardiocondyla obscurior TaxID=286306 RepID=A0AAW2FIA2_9HYME
MHLLSLTMQRAWPGWQTVDPTVTATTTTTTTTTTATMVPARPRAEFTQPIVKPGMD